MLSQKVEDVLLAAQPILHSGRKVLTQLLSWFRWGWSGCSGDVDNTISAIMQEEEKQQG